MELSWDEAKNRANQKKHGVSFERASELFTSKADYLEFFDEAHSIDEDRFIAIGPIRGASSLSSRLSRTKQRSASSAPAGPPSESVGCTTTTWMKTDD